MTRFICAAMCDEPCQNKEHQLLYTVACLVIELSSDLSGGCNFLWLHMIFESGEQTPPVDADVQMLASSWKQQIMPSTNL